MTNPAPDNRPKPPAGRRVLPAAELPVGTRLVDGDETLTKTSRPGRCPWRRGGPKSVAFVANWSAQLRINSGASVELPQAGSR